MRTFAILAVIVIALLSVAHTARAANATTNLHIEGMTCAGCETAVKMVLKKTPGVISSEVSYEEKRAVVSYDAAKTTPEKIAKAVADALSYKVTVTGATAKPVKAAASATSCDVPVVMPKAAKPVSLAGYRTDELRAEFNRASDRVRVVALLSPTCGICQKGQRVVQSVFAKNANDARLRGFVVWLPMLPSDSKESAGAQAASFVDGRLMQQWDGDRASGNLLAKTLGLKGSAWDVYLLYAPGVKWTGDQPPAPTFWMHQLREESGADQRACLNPAVFEGKVAELLRPVKGGA
jgi:periplasmic mercuric ion binding protein